MNNRLNIDCAVDALLSMNNADFNNFVNELSIIDTNMDERKLFFYFDAVHQDLPNIYVGNSFDIMNTASNSVCFPINSLFDALKNRQSKFDPDTDCFHRIEKLIDSRSLGSFIKWLSLNRNRDVSIYNEVFKMLSSDEELSKFINSLSQLSIFVNDALISNTKSFFEEMNYIFESNYERWTTFSTHFYLPGIDSCLKRYNSLSESGSPDVDKFLNPEYTFSNFSPNSPYIIRRGEEPDWEINSELKDYVFDGMPNDLSIEEKAIYIYFKLCKTFKFDDGYAFRAFLPFEDYSSDFSKDWLESINPDSIITCREFSRIYAKFINSLEDNIEAAVFKDFSDHFYTGFFTNNVSVQLESLITHIGLNDFARLKTYSPVKGINVISDKKNLIPNAIDKCYNLLYDEVPSVNYYLAELSNTEATNYSKGFPEKLDSFIQIMKENNLSGNEAIQYFLEFRKNGFFNTSERFDSLYTFIGEKHNNEGKLSYNRLICIYHKDSEPPYYLFDPKLLSYKRISRAKLRHGIVEEDYIIEDYRRPIHGLEEH